MTAVDKENPWPGLSSFTEDAQGFFFGREKETEELFRLVGRQTLTVLFGQSGLGKSSLIHAGLFPRLRDSDHLPLYVRLDHDPSSPPLADQLKAALNDAFRKERAEAPPFSPEESLWEYFHRKDVDIWSSKQRLLTPILAFDQFEEIFTLGRADDTRRERSRAFLTELACLVENRPPPAVKARMDAGSLDPARFNYNNPSCRVILSLREDFLPDLEGLKQDMPALIHNRLRLKRLSGTQALEIVSRPAPHLLASGVAERIVEFVAGGRGGSAEALAELDVEPALLSVICRELNGRRKTEGRGQITAEQVAGDRREILTDFYERSIADMPEAMRHFVEDRLLTKSGYRDNLSLESALEIPGVTRPLVDTLVSRRLLHTEDRLGQQRVELTHDVLAEVIRSSRDARMQRLEIELTRATGARRTRRLRLAVAGMAVALAAAAGGVFALQRARVRELAAAAEAARLADRRSSQTDLLLGSRMLADNRVSDGLAYLVRAARADPGNSLIAPRILTALAGQNFLTADVTPLPLPSPGWQRAQGTTTLSMPRYLADGKTVLVVSNDGILRSIDADSWQITHTYEFGQRISFFTAGGVNDDTIAVWLSDNSVVVCDTATGKERFVPVRPTAGLTLNSGDPEPGSPGPGYYLSISPDGRWVAASAPRHTRFWIYDAHSGELKHSQESSNAFIVFNPAGGSYATHPAGTSSAQFWNTTGFSALSPRVTLTPGSDRPPIYTPDGKSILVYGGGRIQPYDAVTGAPKGRPMQTASDFGNSYDFVVTADGKRAIICGANAVCVYDLESAQLTYTLSHPTIAFAVSASRDGKVLLTNCNDGYARVWDLESGRLLAEPTLRQGRPSPAVLSGDGSKVVLFSATGPVLRLRVGDGAAMPLELPLKELVAPAYFARESPIRIVRLLSDRAEAIEVASGRNAPGGFAYPVRFSAPDLSGLRILGFPTPDQRTVVVRSNPANVTIARVFRLGPTGVVAEQVELEPPLSPNLQHHIHPDGETVLFTGGRGAGGSGLRNLRTGKQVPLVEGRSSGGAFNPKGDQIGIQPTPALPISVRAYPSGQEQFVITPPESTTFSATWVFTVDGSRIVTGNSAGQVQFWNASNGALISTQQRQVLSAGLKFSSDGRRFASLSADGVQVWDTAAASPVGEFFATVQGVGAAVFSPDNQRLAISDTASNQVRILDAGSGQPLTEPVGRSVGQPLGFSPDGRFLLTGSPATTALGRRPHRIWAVPPGITGQPVPGWLLKLATIFAAERLTDDGLLVAIADAGADFETVRREIAALPDSAPYIEWGRWLIADREKRSIAPGFTITRTEAVKLAAELGNPDPFVELEAQDDILTEQNSLAEAEALEKKTLDQLKVRDGEESTGIAEWLLRLASTQNWAERYFEAEQPARKGLAMRQKLNPTDRYGIAVAQSLLGGALVGQERAAEAGPLLTGAFTIIDAQLKADATNTSIRAAWLRTAESLVQVFEKTGQEESAGELRVRIEELRAEGAE